MSASAHPAVLDGPDGTGLARARPSRGNPGPGPAWLPAGPAAITLLVGWYKISGPSFTRDESATLSAVHRSFPQLVAMLGNVDVVHGAYYSLIWVVVQVAGPGPLAVRLPSAVAMALAAAAVTAIGQRLVSGGAGLATGLTFAVLPSVSWFAQNAREGAVVTAIATVATYCFVRLLEAARGRSRRRWLIAYGVLLALLGLANLFALLLVAAHGVTLGGWRRGRRDGAGPPDTDRRAADRRLARGWLTCVAAALIVVSPVAVTGFGQLHQIHWLPPSSWHTLESVTRVIGPAGLAGGTLLIFAGALAIGALFGRARRRAQWPAALWWLCLPWLALPPAILILVSLAHPVYTYRYIAYCIPAAALLIGAALAALGRYAGPVALVLIVLLGLHAQIASRRPDGHGLNVRAADFIVARHYEPGDALLNVSNRPLPDRGTGEDNLETAYPFGLRQLTDLSAGQSAARSATLGGTYASQQVILQRLRGVRRVWVVQWTAAGPVPALRGMGFSLRHHWLISGLSVRLFARHDAGPGSRA